MQCNSGIWFSYILEGKRNRQDKHALGLMIKIICSGRRLGDESVAWREIEVVSYMCR